MMKQKLLISSWVILLFCSGVLMADAPMAVKKSEKDQVREVVRHVLESNEVFVRRLPPDYFSDLIHGQKPIATMVTCAIPVCIRMRSIFIPTGISFWFS